LLHDDLQQMLAYAKMQLQAKAEDVSSKSTLNSVAALLEECIAKSRRLSHEISPAILHQAGLMECCKWLAEKMRKQFGLNVELVFHSELSLEVMPLKIFLFRAVQELLFNIVKHSGVESARVEVVSTEESITMTVSDKGCGFDPEIISSQWDKVGFGLLTIKERADHIGGVFEVKSAPGQGSHFTLTVPIAVAKSDPKAAIDDSVVDELNIPHSNRLKSQKTGIRLLLVDDHQVMRKGLVGLISGKPSIQVVGEASNGLEALEQARKLKPDVILMDISMPKMDGIEATRLIKAELPNTRVIGLTMHEDEQLFEAMRHAGADVTLSKTTSVSELTKTIMGNSEL
jgi:CheY-like chemotaxis protein/two-component sensor histidine kinase